MGFFVLAMALFAYVSSGGAPMKLHYPDYVHAIGAVITIFPEGM